MAVFGNTFPQPDYVDYEKTTTDATVTDVATIPLAEEQTVSVWAKATARNSDGSINGKFHICGLFYRNTSGNVTQVNDTYSIDSDTTSGSTIDLTLAADTTNQTVDIRVTGQTSETFTWKVSVAHIKVEA